MMRRFPLPTTKERGESQQEQRQTMVNWTLLSMMPALMA
jgi:hypothetical protein